MSCCRICKKVFAVTKTSREARFSLGKRDSSGLSLIQRFQAIGFQFNDENPHSPLSQNVCRPCETKLSTIEKAKEIQRTWSINLNDTHSTEQQQEQHVSFFSFVANFEPYLIKWILFQRLYLNFYKFTWYDFL